MEKEKGIDYGAIKNSLLLSIFLSFLFVLVIALLCYLFFIGDKLLWGIVFFSTSLSLILGGLFGFSRVKSRGLLHGGIFGLLYILIMVALRLIFEKKFTLDGSFITTIVSVLLSGMLGGVLGVNNNRE